MLHNVLSSHCRVATRAHLHPYWSASVFPQKRVFPQKKRLGHSSNMRDSVEPSAPNIDTAAQADAQQQHSHAEQEVVRQSGWNQQQPSRFPRMPGSKRSVAMHVAYCGTAFRGLQINRWSAPESTVEGTLEVALLRAGLIAPSNYGDLYRLKWTRSSRTDKGVHSLATVIGLRIVLQDVEGLYTADPEGLGIADRINQHLPPSIKVLCVQRVNKKFTARRACKERTYTYYLPAALLGLKCDQSQEDSEKISLFRSALSAFVGRHPFHNYTPKSRKVLYPYLKPDADEWRARKDAARTARGPVDTLARAAAVLAGTDQQHGAAQQQSEQQLRNGAGSEAGGITGGQQQGVQQQSEQQLQQQHGLRGSAEAQGQESSAQGHVQQHGGGRQGDGNDTLTDNHQLLDRNHSLNGSHQLSQQAQHAWGKGRRRDGAQSSEDDADEGESDEEEAETESDLEGNSLKDGPGDLPQRFNCTCEFQGYVAPENRLPLRVYRVIYSFTAEDPKELVPGGVPCLKLEVHGESFLLNHIRHMIGAAVAVTRGLMPFDLLKASLHAPTRTSVPKAPPHTLILTASKFFEFSPRAGSEIAVEKYTGRELRVREGAARAQQEFQEQVLGPALNDLLLHPNWDVFNIILPRYYWNPEAVNSVLEQDAAWCARRAEFKAQQQLKEEQEKREAEKQQQEDEEQQQQQQQQQQQHDGRTASNV